MHFILGCSSSHEDFNGDCDYALVDISQRFAEDLIRRIEMLEVCRERVAGFRNLRDAYFDDGLFCPVYFGLNVSEDSALHRDEPADEAFRDRHEEWLDEQLSRADYVAVDGFGVPLRNMARVDGDQIVIGLPLQAVWFFAYAGHTDVQITTTGIPFDVLRKIAAGEPITQQAAA